MVLVYVVCTYTLSRANLATRFADAEVLMSKVVFPKDYIMGADNSTLENVPVIRGIPPLRIAKVGLVPS